MYKNRATFIDELNNFISSTKDRFNNVLSTINWSKEFLISGKEAQASDTSSQHEKTITVDQNVCLQEGVHGKSQVIILDMLNGNQLQTVAEQNTKKDGKEGDKAAALAHLLKMERDAKRRRISYKNKVHTKNKSHTEVLREVLEEQMLTLSSVHDNDVSLGTNSNANQPASKAAPELIAIRPPHGNPHLAWLSIVEEEVEKTSQHSRLQTQRSEHSKHSRQSYDHKSRSRDDEYIDRKGNRKDDFWKEKKRKEESDDRHRDKDKRKNGGLNHRERDHSPRSDERHYKKKKKIKRSHSHSPGSDGTSENKRHKSKHKKKKH